MPKVEGRGRIEDRGKREVRKKGRQLASGEGARSSTCPYMPACGRGEYRGRRTRRPHTRRRRALAGKLLRGQIAVNIESGTGVPPVPRYFCRILVKRNAQCSLLGVIKTSLRKNGGLCGIPHAAHGPTRRMRVDCPPLHSFPFCIPSARRPAGAQFLKAHGQGRAGRRGRRPGFAVAVSSPSHFGGGGRGWGSARAWITFTTGPSTMA